MDENKWHRPMRNTETHSNTPEYSAAAAVELTSSVNPGAPSFMYSLPHFVGSLPSYPDASSQEVNRANVSVGTTAKKNVRNDVSNSNTQDGVATCTYPQWHSNVRKAYGNYIAYQAKDTTKDVEQERRARVRGTLSCAHEGHSKVSWDSDRIPITIRKHRGNRYTAVVYKQRCGRCKQFAALHVEKESYVTCVSQWLRYSTGRAEDSRGYDEELYLG